MNTSKRRKTRRPRAKARRNQAALDRKFGHKAPWCTCGCGAEVRKGARFKPGHDARLRPGSKWRKDHPELELGGGHGPNS